MLSEKQQEFELPFDIRFFLTVNGGERIPA
jgi:hypothetical protein